MDRNAQNVLHQRQTRIGRRAKAAQAVEFFNLLTSPQLLQTTEALLPEHRERLYPPTVALSMFMRQVLEADGSCQKAVNGWAARRVADGLAPCSVRTGGYCRARQRLPLEMVSALARETGRLLSQKARSQWLWRGRAVKLVDGTGISMPDTLENQACYPQPNTQAPGVGFPLARLVMVICLATGAALDAAIGPHSGKGTGELGLVRRLLQGFSRGDVMLADALYCNYFLIAALMAAGVDVLFEQNGSRITDFRRGQSLGTRDHLVHWPKPARPQWMTPEQYAGLPDELTVREVKAGHQVLVTTMLDHRKVMRRHGLDGRQKGPLVVVRAQRGIDEDTAAVFAQVLLQRQGNQVTEPSDPGARRAAALTGRHRVLVGKQAVVGCQLELPGSRASVADDSRSQAPGVPGRNASGEENPGMGAPARA